MSSIWHQPESCQHRETHHWNPCQSCIENTWPEARWQRPLPPVKMMTLAQLLKGPQTITQVHKALGRSYEVNRSVIQTLWRRNYVYRQRETYIVFPAVERAIKLCQAIGLIQP